MMATDLVNALGVGGTAVSAVSVGVVAWYVWRARAVGSAAAGAASSAVGYTLVILCVAALALALGWAEFRTGVAIEHLRAFVRVVVDALAPRL